MRRTRVGGARGGKTVVIAVGGLGGADLADLLQDPCRVIQPRLRTASTDGTVSAPDSKRQRPPHRLDGNTESLSSHQRTRLQHSGRACRRLATACQNPLCSQQGMCYLPSYRHGRGMGGGVRRMCACKSRRRTSKSRLKSAQVCPRLRSSTSGSMGYSVWDVPSFTSLRIPLAAPDRLPLAPAPAVRARVAVAHGTAARRTGLQYRTAPADRPPPFEGL